MLEAANYIASAVSKEDADPSKAWGIVGFRLMLKALSSVETPT